MKLSQSVLISLVSASHFRGGSYQVIPGDNDVRIDFTHTWRRGAAGYGAGCTQSHVANQLQSTPVSSYSCNLVQGNGSCGAGDMKYTVTFVEDNVPNANDQYCYGDGTNRIPKTSLTGPATYGWTSCCWVPLTTDAGKRVSGGTMTQQMTVNDWTNTSPTFKLPPIWLIMSGCDAQSVDLAPVDADGDKVKCRWATSAEAGGVYNNGNWPSLTLDGDNCRVVYTGSRDSTNVGVKPVALMIEDFDSAGNVRSSVPIQFLAQVWTPNLNSRRHGIQYPNWFPQEEEHEDHVYFETSLGNSSRGRRSTPPYCTAAPEFDEKTPEDGACIEISSETVEFALKATSQVGTISSFSYQAPIGLTCTDADQNGESRCTWTPTPSQLKIEEHQFCFSVTDSTGLVSGNLYR